MNRRFAVAMFAASLLFLALLAATLHLGAITELAPIIGSCRWAMLALYPLFVLELVAHLRAGTDRWKQHLWFCLLPPMRIGGRDAEHGRSIWLPTLGWQEVDDKLRHRLEKAFSIPMILVALCVLPVLAVEFIWASQIEQNPWLAIAVQSSQALIWLAFTFEFVVMISIVDRKLRYCKEHWIDLAVICLPLVAFLRTLRLGRLMRLQQLGKTVRVMRLRGTLMRTYRAVLLLDAIDRLVRGSPEKRLSRLKTVIAEKEKQLDDLRVEMRELEEEVALAMSADGQHEAA